MWISPLQHRVEHVAAMHTVQRHLQQATQSRGPLHPHGTRDYQERLTTRSEQSSGGADGTEEPGCTNGYADSEHWPRPPDGERSRCFSCSKIAVRVRTYPASIRPLS